MNIFQDSLRGPIQNYRRRSTISTPKKHSLFLEIKNTHQLEPELASSASRIYEGKLNSLTELFKVSQSFTKKRAIFKKIINQVNYQ
ncbi:hypothetical protein pb186bvf_003572 [Paramecium bursaria]